MTKVKKPWWKRLLKFFAWLMLIPIILLVVVIALVFYNQDSLVQKGLATVNESFAGQIKLKDSHISPFHDFPNVCIDLEDLEVYESKSTSEKPIAHVKDVFIDFDLKKIIEGKYRINMLEIIGGEIKIIQDTTGKLNLMNAFESTGPIDTASSNEIFRMGLKKIKIKNVDVLYVDQTQKKTFYTYLDDINAKFSTGRKRMRAAVDGTFHMTFIKDKDTSFIKNKKFDIDAAIIFDKKREILDIKPSKLILEGVSFAMKGFMIFKGSPYMNLQFNGDKSDFNMLFAFLPADLATYMQKYKNAGSLYFDASVKGIVGNDRQPEVMADFGCKNGYFTNIKEKKTIDQLSFRGYFTNGKKRNPSTFEFGLVDMYAFPEQGEVMANIMVRNFEDPKVNMDVSTDFDLQFLAKFLQLQQLQNLSGQVSLKVHYDELVDVNATSKTFAKLKDGVDSELKIRNLTFKMPKYPYPIKDLNLDAIMKTKNVYVENFTAKVGASDIKMNLGITNLPAIFHKEGTPLDIHMLLSSKLLDLKQLTTFDSTKLKPIDEAINGFQMAFTFKTKASNFTDTNMALPHGEFYIDKLCGQLKHYARRLEDLKADVIIDASSLKLLALKGKLGGKKGKSYLDIKGELKNYPMWFKKNKKGTSEIIFDIACDTLKFGKTFVYKNVDYISDAYRRETLSALKLKGNAKIVYDSVFKSMELVLEEGSLKSMIHPLKLENLAGTIKYSDNRIRMKKFTGKMGKNEFTISLGYFLGANPDEAKKNNRFTLNAKYLNLDELLSYDMSKVARKKKPGDTTKVVVSSHDTIFNVFSLPFSNMKIKLDVKELLYQKIHLHNVVGRMRMQKNHYFYIDTLFMDAADGHIEIDGYFNGSDKSKIYFAPNVKLQDVDLAKLMLKFDNFGQEYLVSNNISGHLTGKLNGKVRMHTDLMPIMDESEITMKTSLTNGALKNYAPMQLMKDYFKDKNLNNILFDTLQNTFEIKKGVMYIPAMNINSSLGFIEISGKQAFTSDMDYNIKVPMKMVTDVGFKYLFGKKREEVDSSQVDGIVYRDKDKKVKFVNINIKGNSEDFKISLGK